MADWKRLVEALIEERGTRLVAYGRLVAGSQSDAEDLVHDALVKVFSRRRRITTVAEAEQYTRRAMLTLAIDAGRARRSRQRARERAFERDDPGPDPDNALDVRAALADLPPRERACLVMRYFDDLPVQDIANELGLAPGTVKRYLSDAHGRLAAVMEVPDFTGAEDDVVVEVRSAGRLR